MDADLVCGYCGSHDISIEDGHYICEDCGSDEIENIPDRDNGGNRGLDPGGHEDIIPVPC